jgi:hypothetical protein
MEKQGDLFERALAAEVKQLREWALESRRGGWSTHQVEAMRRRADELEELVEIKPARRARRLQTMQDIEDSLEGLLRWVQWDRGSIELFHAYAQRFNPNGAGSNVLLFALEDALRSRGLTLEQFTREVRP